jgi:putrescine transport system substrate-binding protein
VWPDIVDRLATYDPGNNFAVNYMWGTTGIGYNVKKAKEILGGGVPDSWDIVFKPENLAKFKECGVMMLDSADDIMPAALHYLGLNPNSTSQADLEKAAELLAKVRPSVRKFHSSEYIGALASGEICLVVGWSGDIKQAQKRAAEAKGSAKGGGVEVGYAIPKTGAQMWFDNFAIPKDAKNVAEAHAFIDYMLRPDVAAKNSNFVAYPNGNLASQKLIDPAIFKDATIYPDEATMKSLYLVTARDAKSQRVINRLWTKVKTGK